MLWPVAVWNLGLIGISSEVWPHRASETHTLPLTLPHPDPIFCPHRPYPGNGRFGDFRRGARRARRSGRRGLWPPRSQRRHKHFIQLRTMWKPASRSKCSPSAAAAHVYSAGDRSEGLAGHGQCCLLKPCQTHGGVGKSAWGRATPSPKTSHWSATAWLRLSPAPPQWKNTNRWVRAEVFWGEQTNAVFKYDVDVTKPEMYKAWKI